MPRFSLIVPTLGRTAEAQKLFASLVQQKRTDLELIVVDQNDDDRLTPLLHSLPPSLRVVHLKQSEKNVSLARNAGMDAATGEILAFPDDDCWYPEGLLDRVDTWFRENTDERIGNMQAAALLTENPKPTHDQIREAMAGNICRCGCYQRIENAIHLASTGV